MTKLILTATAFLLGLISFAQVSENRKVSDFSKLKASQGIDVYYTVSTTNSIKVETDDNERLQMIKTEVDGETLKIFIDTDKKTKKLKSIKGKRSINGVKFNTIKVYVTGKSLTSIKASSSAEIQIKNLNKTDKLEVASSSSGSISGNFECSDLKVNASSSGDFKGTILAQNILIEASSSADVELSGKAKKVNVKASSSADCDLKKLIADEVQVKASSSADVEVYAVKYLEATASSSADVDYYGSPEKISVEKSSSGSVNKK